MIPALCVKINIYINIFTIGVWLITEVVLITTTSFSDLKIITNLISYQKEPYFPFIFMCIPCHLFYNFVCLYYIQICFHSRDTTVQSLTIQPVVRDGRIQHEDSPLVVAVKTGRVLVVDEADKAQTHVTCVLKVNNTDTVHSTLQNLNHIILYLIQIFA